MHPVLYFKLIFRFKLCAHYFTVYSHRSQYRIYKCMLTASVQHGRRTNTGRLSLNLQKEGSGGLQPPLACWYIRSFVCARGNNKKKN